MTLNPDVSTDELRLISQRLRDRADRARAQTMEEAELCAALRERSRRLIRQAMGEPAMFAEDVGTRPPQ